jgi:hypothetical protein
VLGPVVALVAAGCAATVTRVRGPDGDDWLAIECKHSAATCYEAAGEACPNGYIIADIRHGSAGSVSYGTVTAQRNFGSYQGFTREIYEGEMLIKCRSGRSTAVAREERLEAAVHTAPAAEESEDSQCNTVFGQIDDLADLWAEWFHGQRMDSLCDDGVAAQSACRGRFNRACGELDDDVQLCLFAKYARTHQDQCLVRLNALPASTRGKLDKLLLQSSGP